ncbi:MAG: hypothetical protein IBX46_08710 [Desulfuromonadales bacterium]|nr:hypothetical protein [Desulfuromonadales bacterium]
MRLFIAIELPVELKTALVKLRRDLPGARWVPAAQIHLTLAFLGEVEEKKIEPLRAGLAMSDLFFCRKQRRVGTLCRPFFVSH